MLTEEAVNNNSHSSSTAPNRAMIGGDGVIRTLYIGDLARTVNEHIVWSQFSRVGPVNSVKVCRNRNTGESLGYAYLNYEHAADAEAAIDRLNYEVVENRPMRVMWAQRDPSVRKLGIGNVFIKNLNKTITTRELFDTFSQFGNVMSCKIVLDDKGQSLGFGFVHFEMKDSAERAIQQVNGMLLRDKKVYVGHFKPKTQRLKEMDGKEQRYNNVYIKNFADLLTDESLGRLFEKFGSIISAKVMCDENGKSKGFGFVSFHDPDHAKKVVETMNGHNLNDSTQIYVARAMKKQERAEYLKDQFEKAKQERIEKTKGVNLYVKHFSTLLDDAMLTAIFAQYGVITSSKIMRHANGESRGFGFVCFTSPEEATRAITELNGKVVLDSPKPLYVSLAQTKEERAETVRLQIQRRLRNQPQLPSQHYAMSVGNEMVGTVNGALATPPSLASFGQLFINQANQHQPSISSQPFTTMNNNIQHQHHHQQQQFIQQMTPVSLEMFAHNQHMFPHVVHGFHGQTSSQPLVYQQTPPPPLSSMPQQAQHFPYHHNHYSFMGRPHVPFNQNNNANDRLMYGGRYGRPNALFGPPTMPQPNLPQFQPASGFASYPPPPNLFNNESHYSHALAKQQQQHQARFMNFAQQSRPQQQQQARNQMPIGNGGYFRNQEGKRISGVINTLIQGVNSPSAHFPRSSVGSHQQQQMNVAIAQGRMISSMVSNNDEAHQIMIDANNVASHYQPLMNPQQLNYQQSANSNINENQDMRKNNVNVNNNNNVQNGTLNDHQKMNGPPLMDNSMKK